MAKYWDFYGNWMTPPNGGAQYRVHLHIREASQNVQANQTTLAFQLLLEKDRSFNGFYDYSASYDVTVDGVSRASGSGSIPDDPWTGWSSNSIVVNENVVITHDQDGKKTVGVGAAYYGANSGWAIGTSGFDAPGALVLTPIPRATTPKITPSPAVVASTVLIDLSSRASSSYTHNITWVSGNQSGIIGLNVGASTTWTVPDVMSEFPGEKLAPIVVTVVTMRSAVVIGTRQATFFARTAPAAPPVPGEVLPSSQFDVRARLVTWADSTWESRGIIPADEITLVDPHSATSTLTLTLSKLNAVSFPDYSVVDVEVFNGTDWIYTDHRFVLSRVEADDADPTQVSTYSGVEYVDYVMGFCYPQNDYNWGVEGHPDPATTPGGMMRHAYSEAKTRGWGARMQAGYDKNKTSLGESWANINLSRSWGKGTPVSQMLAGLVEDGMVEYRTQYKNNFAYLMLLNPGTGQDFGADGSDPVVNLGLLELDRAPRRGEDKRLTRVTVTGEEDVQVTREKAPYDANVFGQMEGWVSASGIKKDEDARTIGDNALRDNSSIISERTFEYDAKYADPQFYPYSVFIPGDWVLIPDGDNSVSARISQITISKTEDGTSLTVLTGDRILSGEASLAKRQAAMTGGSIPGGSGSVPSPIDSRIPAAPGLDEPTSEGYWDSDGAAKSAVTLTWSPISNSINGTSITVNLYEVWWRRAGIGAEWAFRSATSQSSIIIGGWDVNEDLEFRVRARSSGGVYGEFSINRTLTTAEPPVDLDGPTISDLYTDGVGSIYVVWGGLLDGAPAPARLAYVGAEVSSDGGATYAPMGTPIVAAGTIIITPGAWGDYKVRLRGYDRLGNAGDVSAALDITITDPHIDPARPLPPTNLDSTAGAGWDASGITAEAWFDLTWDAPTEDLDGDPVEIAGYDLWGKRDTETEVRFLTSSTTNAVRWRVAYGETWSFQVSATSTYGGVSDLSDTVTDVADTSIDAPDAPDAPTLSQRTGFLVVEWSGNGMAPQVKYAYASISATLGGTYVRAGMHLIGAGEVLVPGLAPGDYYAKINLVDELGQVVSSSAAGPITLLPITGETYQTSPLANTGIKITSAAMVAYNGSGEPTFILDATTGEVSIKAYEDVFEFGADGYAAESGAPVTGLAISSENSSFNTFFHPSGAQIRNDQTPLSWWEADASDANLVNFFSPRAVIGSRLRIGDYEATKEAKTGGASRLVFRYRGV